MVQQCNLGPTVYIHLKEEISIFQKMFVNFEHLRGHAIIVQQCNLGSAAYIHLKEETLIFQRMFVNFEAQKKGFI